MSMVPDKFSIPSVNITGNLVTKKKLDTRAFPHKEIYVTTAFEMLCYALYSLFFQFFIHFVRKFLSHPLRCC